MSMPCVFVHVCTPGCGNATSGNRCVSVPSFLHAVDNQRSASAQLTIAAQDRLNRVVIARRGLHVVYVLRRGLLAGYFEVVMHFVSVDDRGHLVLSVKRRSALAVWLLCCRCRRIDLSAR